MKSKETKQNNPSGITKEKIAAVIAAVIIVCCLGGSLFIGLFQSGILGKEKSSISKKDLEEAQLAQNSDNYEEEEDVTIASLEEDILITGEGLSAQSQTDDTDPGNTADPAATAAAGDYIFPNSSTEYLTDADVSGLSAQELKIARNEIIARHGRIFDSPDLKAHFESKSWYHGTISPADFDANINSYLSKLEFANIDMIKKYE